MQTKFSNWIKGTVVALLAGCSTGGNQTPPVVTSSATLVWTPPPGNVIGTPMEGFLGYRVHFGEGPSTSRMLTIPSSLSLDRYVIDGLHAGTWSFCISALETDGSGKEVEGDCSNVATKTIQ